MRTTSIKRWQALPLMLLPAVWLGSWSAVPDGAAAPQNPQRHRTVQLAEDPPESAASRALTVINVNLNGDQSSGRPTTILNSYIAFDDAAARAPTMLNFFYPYDEAASRALTVFNNDCPPDLNFDGVVNAADLAILLGAWGSCPDAFCSGADLNQDDVVNAADLAQLLGAWGPC